MKKFLKTSFAAILLLFALITGSDARTVRGTVMCGGKPVSDVIVSDGFSFTTTSSSGKFHISVNEDARNVFIVTPAGYVTDNASGVPEFYKRVARKVHFELQRIPDTGDYTLFAISDPQTKTKAHLKKYLAEPMKDIAEQGRRYSSEGQVAAVVLGDIGWDSFELNGYYRKAFAQSGIMMYPVIGNHDFNRFETGRAVTGIYEESFGPVNYAFYIGHDLVIALNNIIYDTDRKYVEGYSEEVLNWLEGLLRYIPRDTHLYVAQHSPLMRWWNDKRIVNADLLLKILSGYKVDMLSGHTHIQNNYQVTEDIYDHNVPSICSAWWATTWCRDGAPRGFEVFRSRGGHVDWFLHQTDWPDDHQVEIIPVGKSRNHPESIVANVWDYDPLWTVEWYQDGRLMGPMEQVRDCSPSFYEEIEAFYGEKEIPSFRKPSLNNHYFKADPVPGGGSVKIVVRNRFGREWTFDVD